MNSDGQNRSEDQSNDEPLPHRGRSNSSPPRPTTSTSDNNESDAESAERSGSMNLFDRLMDSIFDPSSRRNGGSTNTNSETSNPASNSPAPSSEQGNEPALIIINYAFTDSNNTSSSLVMSLPNNPLYRHPATIHEFVRIAAQMAYSSINGQLNRQRGITMEKFNLFPIKKAHELKDIPECSICFEKFVTLKEQKNSPAKDINTDKVPTKKRKLNNSSSQASVSSSQEHDHFHPGSSSIRPGSSSNPPVPSESNSQPSTPNEQRERPKYLSEFSGQGEYAHVAVELPCSHVFGKSCLFEWLKDHSTCPLCRQSCADPEPEQQDSNPLNNDNTSNNTDNDNRNELNIDQISSRILNGLNAAYSNRDDNSSENNLSQSNTENTTESSRPIDQSSTSESGERSNDDDNSSRSTIRSRFFPEIRFFDRSQFRRAFTRSSDNQASSPRPTNPLFPNVVESRRTADGVETRTGETRPERGVDDVLDFLHLRSLFNQPSRSDTNNNSTTQNNDEPVDEESRSTDQP